MSLCFQTFNYPSNVRNCVHKHTSRIQGKKKSPFLNKSSAVRSSKIPLSVQPNGIGIIIGISDDSSLNFAKKLVNLEDEEKGPPHFVLCSNPTLSSELMSLERSYFATAETENISSFDHNSIVERLRRERMFLEKSGVCCLVMPCNILHSWHDEIEQGCCVPFFHVGECVAKELKEAKLRPIEAGSSTRIGVLATNKNLVAQFYKEKLENEGFEVIFPDKATIEHTVIPAVEALNRKDFEGAQNLLRIALQVLLVRAVNKIIIASDNLCQLLPPDDFLWTKCIDPMDALARKSVKYARSVEKGI